MQLHTDTGWPMLRNRAPYQSARFAACPKSSVMPRWRCSAVFIPFARGDGLCAQVDRHRNADRRICRHAAFAGTSGLFEGGFAGYLMGQSQTSQFVCIRLTRVFIRKYGCRAMLWPSSEVMVACALFHSPSPVSIRRCAGHCLQTGLIDTVTVSPIGAIILQDGISG